MYALANDKSEQIIFPTLKAKLFANTRKAKKTKSECCCGYNNDNVLRQRAKSKVRILWMFQQTLLQKEKATFR